MHTYDPIMPSPPVPAPPMPSRRPRAASRLLVICAIWMIGFVSLLTLAILSSDTSEPDERAVVRMVMLLMLIWVIAGGSVQRWQRDRLVRGLRAVLPGGWRTQFVLGCILLALLEEAVTTTLTNLGPALGATTDTARITASKNYLEVVLLHSVIVFVPMFVAWGWLLKRYDFRPAEVMLLYGLSGTLAETISFGPFNLINGGMWVYVYGLMVYLPAHLAPLDRQARRVRLRHWPVAILLPILAVIPWVPVVLLLQAVMTI